MVLASDLEAVEHPAVTAGTGPGAMCANLRLIANGDTSPPSIHL